MISRRRCRRRRQGAPFGAVYHRALAQSLEREGDRRGYVGGVSNITYIDGADTLIASIRARQRAARRSHDPHQ